MSVTIIIVSYKSDSRIQKCLKNLGKKYKKIIIDTSKDMSLKTKVEKKFRLRKLCFYEYCTHKLVILIK